MQKKELKLKNVENPIESRLDFRIETIYINMIFVSLVDSDWFSTGLINFINWHGNKLTLANYSSHIVGFFTKIFKICVFLFLMCTK